MGTNAIAILADGTLAIQYDFRDQFSLTVFAPDFHADVHYNDDQYNPIVDAPEYHHYHCMNPECEYCAWVESALRHGADISQLVSYERFDTVFPLHADADGEYIRDTPAYMSENDLLAWNWRWQVGQSDRNRSSRQFQPSSSVDSSYDSDDDYYYDDDRVLAHYDTDSESYGWDASEYRAMPYDNNMLRHVNWRNLRVIGAGQSSVALTDGKYAIKVGSISRSDIANIESAAKEGWSVPVFYFQRNRRCPNKILQTLQNSGIPKYGSHVDWTDYVNSYDLTCDIAVLGLAEPFVDHESEDDEGLSRAIALRLKKEYHDATGEYWYDSHQYNMAYYKGGLVIIDF